MYSLQFKPQSPKKLDKTLHELIAYLGLDPQTAVHLKFTKPDAFEPALEECHFNVWCQVRHSGGKPQCGWVLAQDKSNSFAEAIFHTVWRNPDGKLIDITPRRDLEKRLLFVPDSERSIILTDHEGRPAIHTYDNVRVIGDSLMTPLTEVTIIMKSDFAIQHGLWPW